MYEQHQDIYRAFNISGFYWLYGFNFHSNHTVGKSCVYFTVEDLFEDGMYYSSNFIKNGSWGKIEYNGTFYSSLPMEYKDENRTVYNSLRARTRSGQWIVMNYTLIYSDYQECSFFRVPNIDNGNGCMVLLANTTVLSGMPAACQSLYNDSCVKDPGQTFRQIYQDGCQPRPDNESCIVYA
ncbi:hypothetical protein V5799_020678 [Amblyomma americanum]|uniref:Lipocalin n=1 Tax=Amblyomma americanum TaxID=6943 RepID=A0AAQ4ETA6_AMBAM